MPNTKDALSVENQPKESSILLDLNSKNLNKKTLTQLNTSQTNMQSTSSNKGKRTVKSAQTGKSFNLLIHHLAPF